MYSNIRIMNKTDNRAIKVVGEMISKIFSFTLSIFAEPGRRKEG